MVNNKRKSIKKLAPEDIPVIQPNACGIDVGAESIFVCVPANRDPEPIREFSTFTCELKNMANWLRKCGVTTIAMESTGVYWIPVFEILDQYGFDVLLVNAQHLKSVPGRKTDVADASWIQRLHSFGLLNGSFRPDDHVVAIRTYVRERSSLMQRAGDELNRVQKALEQMNIKLGHVISDISGETGSSIINAIIKGERDPRVLALHRNFRCKASLETIMKSLEGNWRQEHLFSLKVAWNLYSTIHEEISNCEQEMQKLLEKFEKKKLDVVPKSKGVSKKNYNRSPYCFDMRSMLHSWSGVDLCEIPGISDNIAARILFEIGIDMGKWKSSKHFASWLAVCPGNKISGGKRLSGRTKPSKNRAREALGMAAQSLWHSDSYLGAYYRKMRSKFGAPKANRATSHKLAIIIYMMLKHGKEYIELTQAEFELRHKLKTITNLNKRAKECGYKLVPLEENKKQEDL